MIRVKSIKQKHNIVKHEPSEKYRRVYVLVFFVLFAAGSIIAKLFLLQVVRYDTYRALADNQHQTTTTLDAQRGGVYLADEEQPYPLAVNQQLQMAYAAPREMKDKDASIEKLSQILGLDRNSLAEKLANPNDMFEILKHKLSEEEANQIRSAKLSGVYLQPESFRFYPGGELASQVVGFVGSSGGENKGMYGLEAFWEDKLKGEAGNIKQEGDSRGRWISVSDRELTPARNGSDLVLTINHTVQYEVEKILKDSLEQYAADSGTVVVLDPKTGKILAMANQPSFNPNEYSKTEDISRFLNPAVSQPYESGSVFKTFTEAMGIDAGKINPDTTYVDTGSVTEAGYTMMNSDKKANGIQTMTQVLEKSLNTGVIYIEKLVGNKGFADYVERFGFGQKTGIELPGEARGNTKNLADMRRTINFFTASFGQGLTVTPIQLAAAYGALANKGVLLKPHIIDKIVYSDGQEEQTQTEEVRQVVSENTSKLMGEMLRSVVMLGHGKRADVPGYLVGGKTGTAQVAKEGGGGYEEGKNIGSFAGYAPLNDPQFVVVVKLFNPKNVEWAESSAAPTFGKVMKFLLEYYKVKPTEDPTVSPNYKYFQQAPAQEQTQAQTETSKPKDEKKPEKNDKKP
jgi:cell division protein FtsI/penicillin-binding protein 2